MTLRSSQFGSVFAFDAAMLDPLWISNHFVTTILEFSIFGRETVLQALQKSAKPDVLIHTSVYTAIEGNMYKLTYAPLRDRPNGEAIRCCNQTPKYVRIDAKKRTTYFRCREPGHCGTRTFRVRLAPPEEGRRWILGQSGYNRALLELISPSDNGKALSFHSSFPIFVLMRRLQTSHVTRC